METRQRATGRLRIGVLAGAASSLVMGGGASADVTGRFWTPEGEMKLEYRDDRNVRMRVADDGFVMLSDGQSYRVHRDEDGQWLVIPLDPKRARTGTQPPDDDVDYEVTATGRTETVAGISGDVYEVRRCDAWSGDCVNEGEVVFSDDPRAVQLFAGLRAITGAMSDMEDGDPFDLPVDMEGKGFLKGPEMELLSVDGTNLPSQTFALPPNHRVLDPAEQGAPPPAAKTEGESGGGGIGDTMRGLGRDAGKEAEGETRRGVRESVRDGVRGLFD